MQARPPGFESHHTFCLSVKAASFALEGPAPSYLSANSARDLLIQPCTAFLSIRKSLFARIALVLLASIRGASCLRASCLVLFRLLQTFLQRLIVAF